MGMAYHIRNTVAKFYRRYAAGRAAESGGYAVRIHKEQQEAGAWGK